MLKGPDSCCRILGYGLGIVGNLVPALAQSGVLEECHCEDSGYDVATWKRRGRNVSEDVRGFRRADD